MSAEAEGLRFRSGIILVSAEPERLLGFSRDVLGVLPTAERHADTEPH